jgi:hypothetical protein
LRDQRITAERPGETRTREHAFAASGERRVVDFLKLAKQSRPGPFDCGNTGKSGCEIDGYVEGEESTSKTGILQCEFGSGWTMGVANRTGI